MEAKSLYIKRIVNGKSSSFPKKGRPAVISSYTYDGKRMGGAPTITATLYYDRPLDKEWTRQEFVDFLEDQYYITSIPSSSKDNKSIMYKHELSLVSRREILDNLLFFDVVSDNEKDTKGGDKYTSNQTSFIFGGNIKEFVSRINSCLAYTGVYRPNSLTDKGYYVVIDEGFDSDDAKQISFEDEYITNVLQYIKTTFEQNYYWEGKVCHVGNSQNDLSSSGEFGDKYVLKYGKSLLSVGMQNTNYKIVDMVTGKGSSDNIPDYYPNDGRYGVAIFDVENIDKNDVIVNLSNLYKLGDPVGKTFVLCKSEENTYIDTFDVSKSDKTVGSADEYRGDSGTLTLSAKFNALIGMRIDFSKLKAVSSFQEEEGNGLAVNFWESYAIIVNGEEQNLKNLDNNYICSENGEYELVYRCDYEVVANNSTASQQDYVTIISTLNGTIQLTYEAYGATWFCADGMYFKYEQGGISLENVQTAHAAKCELTYNNGWKPSNIVDDGSAVKVTITGKKYIIPSGNLMPSIYRNSGGEKRFYVAQDETYEKPDGSGDYYSFKNKYDEDNPHQASVSFDDIKPTINGIRNDVLQHDGLGQLFGEIADVAFDGKDNDDVDGSGNYIHPYFYIKLHKFSGKFGFSIFEHALASDTAKINLIESNGCPSCSFEIMSITSSNGENFYNCVSVDDNGELKKVNEDSLDYILSETDAVRDTKNQDSRSSELWIALKKDDSTLGIVMPNAARGFKPKAGDKFVITGIEAPSSLVIAAEKRLDDELIKYMFENNEDKFTLSATPSRIFLQQNDEFASRLNENSKLTIEYNGEKHDVYVSDYSMKVEKDALAEVSIVLSKTLETTQGDMKNIVDAVSDSVDKAIVNYGAGSSLTKAMADTMYLSKTRNDSTPYKVAFGGITSNGGMAVKGDAVFSDFGTFASGMSGFGTNINGRGAEMDSLTLRKSLEVPELRYNRVSVNVGNQWHAAGGGVIQSVELSNNGSKGTCRLKLEDGEVGQIAVGDICMGVFHSEKLSDNAMKSTDDNRGNFQFAGFYTAYWTITAIRNYTDEDGVVIENGEFDYSCRPVSDNYKKQYHPCASMTFVCYGSFTDKDRQQSRYSTLTYERCLSKVNTWEIGSANIRMQIGSLNGFKPIDGVDFSGYSMYCDSIYMSGYLKQLSDLGDPSPYTYSTDNPTDTFSLDDTGEPKQELVTTNEDGTKAYLLHTSIQVRKGQNILTEAQDGESASTGTYSLAINTNGCKAFIDHSTLYISDLDYTNRNTATVEVTIDCEGNSVLTFVYTIVILKDGAKGEKGADGAEHYQEISYAISAKSKISDALVPPSDIKESDWSNTPVSTTNAKPYMWQKVMPVTKRGDEITGSVPVYIRVTGEKGAQGEKGEDGLDGHSWNMRGVAGGHVSSESKLPTGLQPNGVIYLLDNGGKGEAAAVQRQGSSWLSLTLSEGDAFLLNGDIMLLSNKAWVNLGSIKGEQGVQGNPGANGRTTRIFQSLDAGATYYSGDTITAEGFCFLDFFAVPNDSLSSGWAMYQCKTTFVYKEGGAVPPADTTHWKEVSVNAASAFFSVLLARDARIDFLESNSIRVRKRGETTPYAGIGGNFPFWAGESVQYPTATGKDGNTYTFAVDEKGTLYASNAYLTGAVNATSGNIGGFEIKGNALYASNSGRTSVSITPTKLELQSSYSEDGKAVIDTQSNITAAFSSDANGVNWTCALQLNSANRAFVSGTAIDIIAGNVRGIRPEMAVVSGKVTLMNGNDGTNVPRMGTSLAFQNGESVPVRSGAVILFDGNAEVTLPDSPATGDSYLFMASTNGSRITIYGGKNKIGYSGDGATDTFITTSGKNMLFVIFRKYYEGIDTGGVWYAKVIS